MKMLHNTKKISQSITKYKHNVLLTLWYHGDINDCLSKRVVDR